jgi:hypothetical protein
MRYDRDGDCFVTALEAHLPGLRTIALCLTLAGAMAGLGPSQARAQWGLFQSQEPPQAAPAQNSSRGENFSAKPAPQLFASDCTGSGCHRGPQGLGKDRSQSGLASFLREHYTNSRESAAALAAYLAGVPGDARPARAEPRPPRPVGRTEEAKPAERRPAAEPEAAKPEPAKPATARQQRGRQQATAAKPEPAAAEQPPAAVPEPEPAAPAAPPEPPRPQWDIFE